MNKIFAYFFVIMIICLCAENLNAEPSSESNVDDKNPIVAEFDDTKIYLSDFLSYIKKLPPQMRANINLERDHKTLIGELVDSKLIEQLALKSGIEKTEKAKKLLEEVRKNVISRVYLNEYIEKRWTPANINKEYKDFEQKFPKDKKQVQTRIILLNDKAEANRTLKSLDQGADFNKTAREVSAKVNKELAEKEGDLGFLLETDKHLPKKIIEAAFSLNPSSYKLVEFQEKGKTFYAIVKAELRQNLKIPPIEKIKPQLKSIIAQKAIQELTQDARKQFDVKIHDITALLKSKD